MPRTHDIVAKVGEYTNRHGETKSKYKNCGALIQKDGKIYIKLDAIPIHESEPWNGWFQCFEPRQPHEQAADTHARQQAKAAAKGDDFNDDIPF